MWTVILEIVCSLATKLARKAPASPLLCRPETFSPPQHQKEMCLQETHAPCPNFTLAILNVFLNRGKYFFKPRDPKTNYTVHGSSDLPEEPEKTRPGLRNTTSKIQRLSFYLWLLFSSK